MVKREPGESGDDAYRISARLVHAILATILGSVLSIGGYMTVWAVNDARWKTLQEERLTNLSTRIGTLEGATSMGILPIARERIEQLERRVIEVERQNRENHRK